MHGQVNDPYFVLLILFCAAVITIGAIVTALSRIPRAKFAQLQNELETLSERVGAWEAAEEKRVLRKLRKINSSSEGEAEGKGAPALRSSATSEQQARPQDASDAASGEPGSDYRGRTMGETAAALQPDAAPSGESIFESAQPKPSGRDSMPLAVEAFMQHLNEHLHSSNRQTATPSSDDAAVGRDAT